MNFFIDLLSLATFDVIYIVVNWLTKMIHFILYKKVIFGKEMIMFFLVIYIDIMAYINEIIFYWGPQFISKFLKSIFKILKVDTKLFSTFHLQTNGQIEQVNQVLEQYLQHMINYCQDDWTLYSFLVEFLIIIFFIF